ncbi:hypothetical protein GQ600_19554 [Phytophthora cactorum]|nr:hypothetical protein GQ600_19554 [Phytophthora cactorum]
MMSSVTSEQYEVMYTMRSEMFAKKDGQDPQCYGPPRSFAHGVLVPGASVRFDFSMTILIVSFDASRDVTPAERDVFVKYRRKVHVVPLLVDF